MAFVRSELSNTCGGEGHSTHNNENTSTPWQQQPLAECHQGPALPADACVNIVGAMAAAFGERRRQSLPSFLGRFIASHRCLPSGRHPGLHFQCHPPLESCRRRWSHPPGRSEDDFPSRKSVIADPSQIVPIAVALTPVATNSSRASISA